MIIDFTADTHSLFQAVKDASNFILKKSPRESLSCVSIQAIEEDKTIIVRSTDNKTFFERTIKDDCFITSEGTIVVHALVILNFLKSVEDKTIRFTWDKSILTLTESSGTMELPCIDAEEFLTFPKLDEKPESSIKISSSSFREAINRAKFAAAKQASHKYDLRAASLWVDSGHLFLLASDGRRVSQVMAPSLEESDIKQESILLPITHLEAASASFATDIEICFLDNNKFMIKSGDTRLLVTTLDVNFPREIFLKFFEKLPQKVVLPSRKIAFLAKKVALSEAENILLKVTEGKITLEGHSRKKFRKISVSESVDYTNSDTTLKLDCDNFVQFMVSCGSDPVTMYFIEDSKISHKTTSRVVFQQNDNFAHVMVLKD